MRVKLNAIVGAAVVLLAGAASAQDMVVKIGHVGPTSGGIAHLGKDNENGARMAIDELNAKGVTIGGKKAKFELVAEDDAGDPKQGTAVAQKLVDSKVNGVIGHLNSGTSIPASKVYSDAGIPQISPSATNPKYTRQGFKTTFRVVADDVHLGGTLGRYAVKELKGKSIAVIDDRTAYGQGVAEEFSKAVKASGGAIAEQQFTTDKATDFTAILTAIKAKKPDIVFYGGMDAVAGPMLRQMKQLGINAKMMGGDGICSSELPKLSAGAMGDGQVICAEAGGVEGSQKAGMDKFKEDFKKKFNADVQIYAPYVYDAVNVMVAAMVKAGSADPKVYLPALAKTEGYKGVTGVISFDEKGDIKNGALTLYTYKGDKREQIAVVR
jgi:branched-chain amino acid transport system substrate-binding protein